MRLVRTAQVVILALALAPSLPALAESGSGGAQQAGGAFMTPYPPAATAPTRAAPATQGPWPRIAARGRRLAAARLQAAEKRTLRARLASPCDRPSRCPAKSIAEKPNGHSRLEVRDAFFP